MNHGVSETGSFRFSFMMADCSNFRRFVRMPSFTSETSHRKRTHAHRSSLPVRKETKLTKAEGQGRLYLADSGKRISILNLQNESIFVNGNDLLALEQTIEWDIKMMHSIAGMMAGGLFNVKLTGTGMIAITSHFQPMTLRVTPDQPVTTDPNATIAWSGNLMPEFKKDISLKTFFGRGSGESIQMHFRGNGFVVVQPFEEVYFQAK